MSSASSNTGQVVGWRPGEGTRRERLRWWARRTAARALPVVLYGCDLVRRLLM